MASATPGTAPAKQRKSALAQIQGLVKDVVRARDAMDRLKGRFDRVTSVLQMGEPHVDKKTASRK